MKARTILSALALLAIPVALEAQESASVDAVAVVEATIDAGLPEAPVRRTVQEGRARGAGEAAVVRAALATRARLEASRDALRGEDGEDPTSAEIVAGADALLQGAHASDLRRVHEATHNGRSSAASLDALSALTARTEDPAQASATVAGWLRAGVKDSEILTLAERPAPGGDAIVPSNAGAVDASLGAAASVDLVGAGTGLGATVIGGLRGGL